MWTHPAAKPNANFTAPKLFLHPFRDAETSILRHKGLYQIGKPFSNLYLGHTLENSLFFAVCVTAPQATRNRLQNSKRNANCRIRGSAALVIRMKFPLVTVPLGFDKFTLLKMLNASKRNWNFIASVTGKSL